MRKRIIALLLVGMMSFSLVACNEAKKVSALIDGLGTVTLESDAAITEAENAYNELSDADKEKIENHDTLVAARADYETLVLEDAYNEADKVFSSGDYDTAKTMFEDLGDYSDAQSRALGCDYEKANALLEKEEYDDAYALFESIGEYQDSKSKMLQIRGIQAEQLVADKKYKEALAFIKGVEGYKDDESLSHLFNVCNVHVNGLTGLMQYMKENVDENSSGNNAELVKVKRNATQDVLIYYSEKNESLNVQVTTEGSKDGVFTYTLYGENSDHGYSSGGSYFYSKQDLQQISASQGYYYGYLSFGGKYYSGYIINASGSADLKTFKKGDTIELESFSYTTSAEDDASITETMRKGTALIVAESVAIVQEGLQQFLDNHELGITLKELL